MPGKYLNEDDPVQPYKYGLKSKVIAEFVDDFPEPINNSVHLEGRRREFQRQEGFLEALELAFNNPNRAMLLVRYDVDKSKSKQRSQAKTRVQNLDTQGYNRLSGWDIRAVGNEVYVMYTGLS